MPYRASSRHKYFLETKGERLSPFLADYVVWFNVSSFMIPETVADVIWAWNKRYIENSIADNTKYSYNSFWEVFLKGSIAKTTQMFMFVREYIREPKKEVRLESQKIFMKAYPRLKPLAIMEFFEALEADIDMTAIRRDFDAAE